MKLPFVSRVAFDVVVDARDRMAEELRIERERVGYLTDMIVQFKMGGATLMKARADQLERIQAGGATVKPPRSGMQQAIDENKHARANPRLAAWLGKWADKQLALGVSQEQVELRLRSWSVIREVSDDDEEHLDDGTDIIDLGGGDDGEESE
jgi:hypothetical protein